MQLEEEKPVSKPRRKKHSTMHHEEDEGWAVSYSDMLMVLMSFFIIFYNSEEMTGGDGTGDMHPSSGVAGLIHQLNLDQLSIEVDPETGKVIEAKLKEGERPKHLLPGFPEGKEDKFAKQREQFSRGIASIMGKDKPEVEIDGVLEGVKFSRIVPKEVVSEGKENSVLKGTNDPKTYKGGIMIDFPDSLYQLGKFELTDKARGEMKRVFALVKPYQEKLSIVFIGHSDSIPVKGNRKVVNSNLILSSLRATKAVEYAVDQGFDPFWVSSQGLSQHIRNTRSLSMRIMER